MEIFRQRELWKQLTGKRMFRVGGMKLTLFLHWVTAETKLSNSMPACIKGFQWRCMHQLRLSKFRKQHEQISAAWAGWADMSRVCCQESTWWQQSMAGESRRTGHNWSGMSCKAQIAAFHIFQSTLVVQVVLVLVVQVVHSQWRFSAQWCPHCPSVSCCLPFRWQLMTGVDIRAKCHNKKSRKVVMSSTSHCLAFQVRACSTPCSTTGGCAAKRPLWSRLWRLGQQCSSSRHSQQQLRPAAALLQKAEPAFPASAAASLLRRCHAAAPPRLLPGNRAIHQRHQERIQRQVLCSSKLLCWKLLCSSRLGRIILRLRQKLPDRLPPILSCLPKAAGTVALCVWTIE